MVVVSNETPHEICSRRRGAKPSALTGERVACLEQRLQVAQDPAPAAAALLRELARHHPRHDGCALELVRYREATKAALCGLYFPRDTREAFGLVLLREQEAIGLHQLVGRVGLDDLAIDDDIRQAHLNHHRRSVPAEGAAGT